VIVKNIKPGRLRMDKLPSYINCKNENILVCDYYMCKNICPETCAYAEDIRQLGIGGPMIPIGRQSEKGIDTEINDSQKKPIAIND